jgi:hypothetical protein
MDTKPHFQPLFCGHQNCAERVAAARLLKLFSREPEDALLQVLQELGSYARTPLVANLLVAVPHRREESLSINADLNSKKQKAAGCFS